MEWSKVSRSPRLFKCSSLPANEHFTFLDSWLTSVMKEYVSQDLRLFNIEGRYPWWSPTFSDSERQLTSVLYPALRQYSEYIFLEMPFEKRNGKRRYLDFWVHSNRATWGIELKDAWQNIGRLKRRVKKPKGGIIRSWTEVVDQALDPRRFDLRIHSEPIFKIAILAVRLYENVKGNQGSCTANAKDLMGFSMKFMSLETNDKEKHHYRPNWGALWLATKEMQKETKDTEESQVYPAAIFLCRAFPA